MKAPIRLGLAVAVVALSAGVASAATPPLRLIQAGKTPYPEKSYILTLPVPRSLTRSDVRVTEDGVPVTGLTLTRQGTVKSRTAVVIAIDESLTMKGKPLAAAFAAARAFARQASPDEEVAIVTFNGAVDVVQPLTNSAQLISRALARPTRLVYGTKNYDALERAAGLIESAGIPGSVIILTDGQNVGSVARPAAALGLLEREHVRVFSVGLHSPAFDPAALQQMASVTGGVYVQAAGPAQLKPILLTLGRRLASEYLLDYTSHANPGIQVAVQVSVSGLGVARTAYQSPPLKLVAAPIYKPSQVDRVIESPYLAFAVILLFGGLIWFAVAYAARPRSLPLVSRVGDFVSIQQAARAERAPRKPVTSRRGVGLLVRRKKADAGPGRSERLAATLELADLEISVAQLVALTVLLTIVAMFILSATPLGSAGIVLGLGTPLLVRWLIRTKIARKRKAFADQLPDNLDVLSSALRAGHSLVGALTVVADDAPEPAKGEFRRVLAEEQFGAQLEDAFKVVVERMQNADLEQVALVARLQREMGSNSAEVLDRVIETVRARTELRRLVGTLTAQGRLSRWVLTLLPVAVAGAMLLINPSYMHPLFHKTFGIVMLITAAVLVALGSFVIGKIIDIKA